MMRNMFRLSLIIFSIYPLVSSSQIRFDPTSLPGLKLWMVSDSVSLSGNAVMEWKDMSGNNYSAIQNTGSSQPLYVDSISKLNNYPVVRFDGSDDFFSIDSSFDISAVFMVVNWSGQPLSFPEYEGLMV